MSQAKDPRVIQLELPFQEREFQRPERTEVLTTFRRQPLRLIQGGNQRKIEPLLSRDAVVRVMVDAGADLLLRRISPDRAEEIQEAVDRILVMFDEADRHPNVLPILRRELDALEIMISESKALGHRRREIPR